MVSKWVITPIYPIISIGVSVFKGPGVDCFILGMKFLSMKVSTHPDIAHPFGNPPSQL